MMFYACLSILVLTCFMCFCVTISIIDLERYNFGLYIVLLCIVGIMLSFALCIATPQACSNPVWFSNFCVRIQEMYPVANDGKTSPTMNGLRSMIAKQTASATHHSNADDSKVPLRNESRATVMMMAPAIHIMHQLWRGMAWVTDGIDDEQEDVTVSHDIMEQGLSSDTHSDIALKRLSTVVEQEQEDSTNDIIV